MIELTFITNQGGIFMWLRRFKKRLLSSLLVLFMLLSAASATVYADVDPNRNIAPDAITKVDNNNWSASYPGSNAVDGNLASRWACRSADAVRDGVAPILTLTYNRDITVNRTGLNSYGTGRLTAFKIEYLSGSSWLTAFEYSGASIDGPTSNSTAANTRFFEFAPVTCRQIRLVLTSGLSGDPSLWEWELYETMAGPGIYSATPQGELTSAGGNITINLTGSELSGKAITATVNGITYPATITSDTTATVTVSLPANTGKREVAYAVTYTYAGVLSGVTTVLTVPPDIKKRLVLQYNAPAADSADGWKSYSLPIGNGYQGANVFGRVNQERVQLSEESLWSGGPVHNINADVRGSYDDNGAYGNINRVGTLATPDLYQRARALAIGAAGQINPPNNTLITGSASTPMYNMFPLKREALGLYQNFSEVYIPLRHGGATITESSVQNYLRWLDIEDATSGVEYTYNGVTYTREYFASYPSHVIVARFGASEKGKVSLTLNPTIPHMTADSNNSDQYNRHLLGKTGSVLAIDTNTIELSGMLRQNGLRFAAQFKIIRDGGTAQTTAVSGNGAIRIDDANSVIIIMSFGTDYVNDFDKRYRTGEDPMIAVRRHAEAAAAKEYNTLREEHVKDYKGIFDNFKLDLGGSPSPLMTDAFLTAYRGAATAASVKRAFEELYIQYGRYLIIASSRPGSLPSNLQGVWNSYRYPNWQSDYHLNINLQMNYWPSNSTNMKNTLYALVDYIDSLRKPGRTSAYHIYGVGTGNPNDPTGFVAHVSSNVFGFTGLHNSNSLANGYQAQYSPESAMWMVQNVYNMYQYYPDKEYLRNRIYPIMKEAVLFYSNPEILVYDPASGRMVMSPSMSSEHGPSWGGATFQQQLLWQLFTDFIEAAEILNEDAELRKTCADLIPKLEAVQIGPRSGDINGGNVPGIKEWWWETRYGYTNAGYIPWFNQSSGTTLDTNRNNQHRHLSHMVGLFPGNLITEENPEWLTAARNSAYVRGDAATGWSRGLKTNLWARVGDGNQAFVIFNGLLTDATLTNLWDYHTGSPAEGTSNSGIFQFDGNAGGTSGAVEMLLQSHAGYIKPLPALPDVWSAGSVSGLTARGGFVVDMAWSNKKLTSFTLKSSAGLPCSLKYGDPSAAIIFELGGGKVKTTVNPANSTVNFATQTGKTYVLLFENAPIFTDENDKVFDKKASRSLVTTMQYTNTSATAKLPVAMIVAVYAPNGVLKFVQADKKEILPMQSEAFNVGIELFSGSGGSSDSGGSGDSGDSGGSGVSGDSGGSGGSGDSGGSGGSGDSVDSFAEKGYYAHVYLWNGETFAPLRGKIVL